MAQEDPLRELFDSLIEDDAEKKIIKMIIDGKRSDEIIDTLLDINKEGDK